MDVVKGKKYMILTYPDWDGDTDLTKVKVRKIYRLPDGREIVEYIYNYPFPITNQIDKSKFKSWIATEIE